MEQSSPVVDVILMRARWSLLELIDSAIVEVDAETTVEEACEVGGRRSKRVVEVQVELP